MTFLQVSRISKLQGGTTVLKDTSFTIDQFRKTAVAGETGAGKTTLLKIIAGLEQPATGKVLFEGKRVIGPDETLVPGHPSIAYLSQHFELRNNYRVEDLLDYANKLTREEAAMVFEICRIDHLLKRKTDQLSGGEKQRIALSRLLVGSPKLLLLDEPFSNMDPIHKNLLKSVLHDISRELQITCVLTSHDPMDTLSWADEIMVMQKGQIIQKAAPIHIYHRPVNEYTGGLFGTYNLITGNEAAMFPGLQEQVGLNKQLFIRPEQFSISHENRGELQGTVVMINFWGAYYEIEVLAFSKLISIKTMETGFKVGDIVFIAIKPDVY